MALNTSHSPDGQGVLIYNGEMILLYIKEVNLKFEHAPDVAFKGGKKGKLYLTSHRIIFTNKDRKDRLQSFCMPFHCLREVKLEQPVFGTNYLKGTVLAQPGGNWEGSSVFNLSFHQGGCIDFGKALLRATELAGRFSNVMAPPPYAPPAGGFFSPPPAYYSAPQNYNGFQAPTHVFPDQPNPGSVYMYESPPPYSGIGPSTAPYQNQMPPQQNHAPPPFPAGSAYTTAPLPSQPPPPAQQTVQQIDLRQSHGAYAGASAPPPPSYQDATRQ